jgi:hypothetical protein
MSRTYCLRYLRSCCSVEFFNRFGGGTQRHVALL